MCGVSGAKLSSARNATNTSPYNTRAAAAAAAVVASPRTLAADVTLETPRPLPDKENIPCPQQVRELLQIAVPPLCSSCMASVHLTGCGPPAEWLLLEPEQASWPICRQQVGTHRLGA